MEILNTTLEIGALFDKYELCRLQADQVKKLASRLEKREVTIAVIGQFKRGKTTLVNSILGEKLLPVGIVPITAAVTRIQYGQHSSKVHFLNGLSEDVPVDSLHEYISEQENHNNQRQVAEVSINTEAEFLRDGLVLVDTPGVGSVHENNSRSAYDFARESDGVIFLLSVDSPINQIEVDFLKSVRRYAGKFYFAVNKVDTVDEEDLNEYISYCTTLLKDIMEIDESELKLIPVSAKRNRGVEILTDNIREDLLTKASEIMTESVRLKLIEILENTRKQISSYREVLKMAPNVFNMRFRELEAMLQERRERDLEISQPKLLRAQMNDEKNHLIMKIRELFGIEYFYYIDPKDAAEVVTRQEYIEEMSQIYDELEATLNTVFMYKETDVYTVARRIEDLNILIYEMRKYTRKLEQAQHM